MLIGRRCLCWRGGGGGVGIAALGDKTKFSKASIVSKQYPI